MIYQLGAGLNEQRGLRTGLEWGQSCQIEMKVNVSVVLYELAILQRFALPPTIITNMMSEDKVEGQGNGGEYTR